MKNNIKLRANVTMNGGRVYLVVCREVNENFCWYVDDTEKMLEDIYPVDSVEEAKSLLFNFYPKWAYDTKILT